MQDVLLTGATGFLGKVVLAELLRRRRELGVGRVHVLVRSNPGAAAAQRARREIFGSRCLAAAGAEALDLVGCVAGDLERPRAGIPRPTWRRLRQRVGRVIHCAAAVEFDRPLADAARANVTTALTAQELAADCPALRAFVAVSTAYVWPGTRRDPAPETPAPLPLPADELYSDIQSGRARAQEVLLRTGHPNTYTLSKCLAEHLLAGRSAAAGTPLTIVRPSIVSAALRRPAPGWIDSPAAFAAFVLAIGTGRLGVLRADPAARLDLVPVDHVASRVIAAASRRREDRFGIEHAVAGPDHSPDIAECCRAITDCFTAWTGRRLPQVRFDGTASPQGRGAEARLNRLFAPFMTRSHAFSASTGRSAHVASDYLRVICRGVARHLCPGVAGARAA